MTENAEERRIPLRTAVGVTDRQPLWLIVAIMFAIAAMMLMVWGPLTDSTYLRLILVFVLLGWVDKGISRYLSR